MIKVALVGCAHIHTPGFARRLQERDDVQVTAIWDHQRERAERWQADLGADVAPDIDAIWADDTVDAVVICSETDRHEPLVRAAAAAGKHLFVEKPLGMQAEDAYNMADAIEASGIIFQTGYFHRGRPVNQFLKQQIDAGNFGKITRLRLSNCHAGAIRDFFTPDWLWMTDPVQAGGGGFGDLGTHVLDIMLWLLGDVESVTATVDVALDKYDGCDETGEALLKFKNGVIGSLAAGWVDVANPVSMIISGTEGHAHVSNGDLYFTCQNVEGADGEKPWTDLPTEWPHAFELFLDAVGGKEGVPLVGAREAAVRSDVMAAMYEAASEQTWVSPRSSEV